VIVPPNTQAKVFSAVNVLMIVIDTLRADHLGCYGYRRATSPHIDTIAASGVLCESAFSTAIPTHPAFTTMYTGQYSITHGVVAHGGKREIPRTMPWLPEILNKNGYTTCAVDNLGDFRLGFDRGYEFYIDPTRKRVLNINADNREINARAIPWLQQHTAEKFFLLVHYWDPHTPYLPPRAYRELFYEGADPCDPNNHSLDGMERHPLGKMWRETWFSQLKGHVTDAEYITALYDGEIRYCDEGLGQLVDTLDGLGLADDTLVIITGDHGELMYHHGIFFDHHGLYDGNIHVPLLFRHPSLPPARLPHMVAHVDIAPTVLGFCGIVPPETMEGLDLRPLLTGESKAALRDFVVTQECTWQMKWAIRTGTHKLICARDEDFYGTPPRELYDLASDPDERHNIMDEEPRTAQVLQEQLDAWLSDKMQRNALADDPLRAHGLTLGRRWKEERAQDPHQEPK